MKIWGLVWGPVVGVAFERPTAQPWEVWDGISVPRRSACRFYSHTAQVFPPPSPQAPLSPPFPGSFPRAGPSCRRARGNRNMSHPDWGEGGGKTFLRPQPLPQAPGAGSVGRACCASSLRRCVGLGGKGGTHPLPPPFLAGEPAGQPYRGPMVAVAFVRPAARPWAGYPPPNPRPGGGNPKPRTGRNHHPAPHPVHLHRQAHRW